jgi:hypothetical protein
MLVSRMSRSNVVDVYSAIYVQRDYVNYSVTKK